MRFEDGDIKGNLWCDSEKLRKMGKNKRLKELYENLVAASSENLIDFAGRMGKKGLMKIAYSEQETRNQEFWFKVRRKNEKLFKRRKMVNGFSVICPDYVKCMDVDHPILSGIIRNYVSAGFIQHSPSGNGRFHAFCRDRQHIMNKFNTKLSNGFDVLQGNNQIFFQK
jgi:cellulose synthase/poly-beta-1,6-N-acetylglucosamine synthase-like glycosyltransferase